MKHFLCKKAAVRVIAVITGSLLFLSGCSISKTEETPTDASLSSPADTAQDGNSFFTARDYEVGYDENESVLVTLDGTAARFSDDSVTADGQTLTLTGDKTYILTGAFTGEVIVNADKTAKPHIILRNADIQADGTAALKIAQADKVFVTLDANSVNTLSCGGDFSGETDNTDGAVFSKDDLTFNGAGALTVSAEDGHGIVCKDDLVFTGGTYNINASEHGIDANDSVCTVNASVSVTAQRDGIHCENTDDADKGFVYMESGNMVIDALGDGISAGAHLTVNDGTVSVTSGGGSAAAEQKSAATENADGFHGEDHINPGGRPDGAQEPQMNGARPGMPGRQGEEPPEKPDGQNGEPPEMPGNQNGEPPEIPGGSFAREEDTAAAELSLSESESGTAESCKGMKAAGEIVINGGVITVDSADDTIHSDSSITVNGGTLTLKSGDDGIHADETLTVSDGIINVTQSYEGLEAPVLNIAGGTISVKAEDDGLNAAGGRDASGFGGPRGDDAFGSGAEITISGGQLDIQAAGDGIDSNGSVSVSGGSIFISCPTVGDTSPFDYETTAEITGGTFTAAGSDMMAQTFRKSTQGVIVERTENMPAGTPVTLSDESGELLTFTPVSPFRYVIISSPALVKGQTYKLDTGGTSVEVTAE